MTISTSLEAETSPQIFFQSLPRQIQISCHTAAKVQTVEEIVNLPKEPKIANLQAVDETMTYKVVGRILLKMVKDMNLPNGLSSANIIELAKRITTDNDIRYWLTLSDVSLLCRRIANNFYGNTYGHFGIPEFWDCLIQYCNERRECHRRNAEKSHINVVDPSTIDVGYHVGEDGRLVFHHEKKESVLDQPLYRYDDHGRRIGINPKGYFGQKQAARNQELDRKLEMAKELMKNDPNLELDDAINMVEDKINKTKQQ